MKFKVTVEEAMQQLATETQQRFTAVMKHGSMIVEYYAPDKQDLQTPHRQDELYIIISGSGIFYRHGERVDFKPGDTLFVPAGMEHHFEDFTDDFATWVIFYGQEAGEKE